MTDAYIETVSERYIELYEKHYGEPFFKADVSNLEERIKPMSAITFPRYLSLY